MSFVNHMHCCHHCGCEVTAFATYGLSCVQSQGHYHCHSSLNDIIHRHLGFHHNSNPVESLVPMVRGQMVLPWFHGNVEKNSNCTIMGYNMRMWTPMHLLIADTVADQAERRKSDKYSQMDPNMYLFALDS